MKRIRKFQLLFIATAGVAGGMIGYSPWFAVLVAAAMYMAGACEGFGLGKEDRARTEG